MLNELIKLENQAREDMQKLLDSGAERDELHFQAGVVAGLSRAVNRCRFLIDSQQDTANISDSTGE